LTKRRGVGHATSGLTRAIRRDAVFIYIVASILHRIGPFIVSCDSALDAAANNAVKYVGIIFSIL
jgi:hypothetical protein